MSKFMSICAACVLVAATCVIAGCATSGYKPDAQGAPYEIVVVADHPEWNGALGDTIRSMFHERFPMINRQETSFDILRVRPSGFKTLITRHRNILILNVDEQYATAALELVSDVWAKSQTVITAKAPDDASMLELINANRDDIMLLLESAERDRDVADAKSHTPVLIAELIKGKFGFEISMGPGYVVKSESENFLWLAYNMPTSDQGIIIYTYPFSGLKDFELDNLLKRRSEFVSRIPGENPGSYMNTNTEYINLIYKKIDGRQWAEMRGFWDVKGDFLGGPYRNLSTLDAANQRVIAIDFYVFSPNPRLSQRNYIKQLEHYLYTVKIPNTTVLE